MKDEKYLKMLIYCHKCYFKPKEGSKDSNFFIGECMHIICKRCFNEVNSCSVCHTTCSFIILDNKFIEKLLRNPSESFNEPIESCMFQLSSALNLIMHQKAEIMKLKTILHRAKDELSRLRLIKRKDLNIKDEKNKGLFNFKQIKEIDETQNQKKEIKKTIDKIYYEDKNNKIGNGKIELNKCFFKENEINKTLSERIIYKDNVRRRTNPLMELTNRGKKKFFTDYDPSQHSISSSKSSRITIPHMESQFKYVYRKQDGF